MGPVMVAGLRIGTACVGLWGVSRSILIGFMASIVAAVGFSIHDTDFQSPPLFPRLATLVWIFFLGAALVGIPLGLALRQVIRTVRKSN